MNNASKADSAKPPFAWKFLPRKGSTVSRSGWAPCPDQGAPPYPDQGAPPHPGQETRRLPTRVGPLSLRGRGLRLSSINQSINLSIYLSFSSFFLIFLSHLSFSSFSLSIYFLSLPYSSRLYPASSPAGRIPSCGGIAHPKGKHRRRLTVFCLPAADSRPESGTGFTKG
jgi:hypothetical protein